MKYFLYILFSIFLFTNVKAQDFISVPSYVNMSKHNKKMIVKSLDSLYQQIIIEEEIDSSFIEESNRKLTIISLKKIQHYELKEDSIKKESYKRQLINIFPITKNTYSISIICTIKKENNLPIVLYLTDLIAKIKNNKVTFSIPLEYLTRYWKKQKIGNITYHYRNNLDKEKAIIFNKKNNDIANLFDIKAQQMDFYMCDNYQEILNLMGHKYSLYSNGSYLGGYGVIANTIFMNHEDFSHDIFHYYSGLVNQRKNRNWIAEEGLAYTLGNAYYTDEKGEMVTQKRLLEELRSYLNHHKDTTLWTLFEKDYPIFDNIAENLSVRSVISSVIIDQVILTKGKKEIIELINSGGQEELTNYMRVINKLIGINKKNFNTRLNKLIQK